KIVVMHQRGIPANPANNLPESCDIITELQQWAKRLAQLGIPRERLILDPGIGFGKSAAQNWQIIQQIEAVMQASPGAWLVGHSRKSLLAELTSLPAAERDPETLGLSLHLAQAGVEYLRV